MLKKNLLSILFCSVLVLFFAGIVTLAIVGDMDNSTDITLNLITVMILSVIGVIADATIIILCV